LKQEDNSLRSILFIPDNVIHESKQHETILDAAKNAGIPLVHVCQGNARCSTCRVQVLEGSGHTSPRSGVEQTIADQMGFGDDIRLACQTRITGDIKVRRLVLDEDDIELTSLLINEARPYTAGVEKHVLILFSDIRGFTPMSETMLPYDIVHILNRYFSLMNHVIEKHGGKIDNYLGDGFLALFEVDSTEDDVMSGIKAGLEMLDTVRTRISPYMMDFFGKKFRIGIGLHFGLVVAGSIGSLQNSKQTIIGDAVNFASRIESSNKPLGTEFLVSHEIYSFVKNRVTVGKTDSISIPGKMGTHTLYEIVGLKETNVPAK
jgi:adenylate cyclase